ncbi:guanine nucleotide-binding protein subunit beta 1 [Scheffersomyces spartinae]|uniref:Guanine nucleotide-binding protein subunit beta 1 n=1 Tax=Scheffersomyces spartinae TaxID=45513 RepID=A0A9P7VDM0_9ASCO|nr:guanine nucleotide-binding protein subunit beta 1 [Scheffersomyces spartinae]KAG7195914.1 guanine nucleotide-binding protein subunit beta 1 [Scheffersomyces spartinae]
MFVNKKHKKSVQDASLPTISQQVDHIPRNSCNLNHFNTFTGHHFKIASLRWGKNSKTLLTTSQDGFMIVWDAVTGYKKHAIPLENPWVLTCAYSPSESVLASAGLDNVCTIYKQVGFQRIEVVEPGGKSSLRTKSNSPNYFQSQSHSSTSTFSSSSSSSLQVRLKGHTAYIPDCGFLSNHNIVTVSGDSTCILWDITRSSPLFKYTDHTSDVLCLATSYQQLPANPYLFVTGSSDGTMKIWDTRTKFSVRSVNSMAYDVNCLSIFPDSNAIASGVDDGSIHLYDVRADCIVSKYCLETQKNKTNYYPNQLPPLLPTTLRGGGSRILSLQQSIQSTANLPGVTSIDFSKSGRLLYSTYSESGCLIWDVLKGEVVGSVGNARTSKFSHVSVSPDGEALATVGWDASIGIWTSGL